jgi:2-oxoglutarate dehydrogenase E2 component (dihydrolipoamide succinyltransferase)
MVASRRTSAHVHSVFKVDFSRVAKLRDAKKAEYERAGAKLTYLPFIAKAVVAGLRAVPALNASVDGDTIVHHKAINIGIAVALDWGLIEIASSTTTTRFSTIPIPRMATCGWLMIGVPNRAP